MRMLMLIIGDIRFQYKYGFYFTYAVFTGLYAFTLLLFPEAWQEKAAIIMVYSDPAAMGLFFMGAIVLLEKSQRVLNALAVSPVKVFEYITAKIVSLMLISVFVSLVLAVTAGLKNIPTVLVSTALTSIIFTLLGLILAVNINTLNQYIFAIVPVEIICMAPPIIYLFIPNGIMRWFPLNASIALISNASQNIFIDIFLLSVTIIVLFAVAYHLTIKMWSSLGGVKL